MTLKTLCCLLLTATLVGCAGKATTWKTEPYKFPKDSPSAELINAIYGAFQDGESIKITTPLDDCETIQNKYDLRRGELFSIKNGESTPANPILVPAGKPFYIQYFEVLVSPRRPSYIEFFEPPKKTYCAVHVVVNLEAGKKYILVGGFNLKKGPVPILMDTQQCRLGVVDHETKAMVPSTQTYCRK